MLDENQVSKSSPAELRLHEAVFFYNRFRDACGPPRDSYFEMISFFDAFLFALTSIEEMLSPTDKSKLHATDVFMFLRAARNVTTHHSVLAAPNQPGGFARPFSRNIQDVAGVGSAKLRINVAEFKRVFHIAATNFPPAARGFQAGITYLSKKTTAQIDLVDEMKNGMLVVKKIICSNVVI